METKLGHDRRRREKKRNTGGLLLASFNRVQALPLIRQTELWHTSSMSNSILDSFNQLLS